MRGPSWVTKVLLGCAALPMIAYLGRMASVTSNYQYITPSGLDGIKSGLCAAAPTPYPKETVACDVITASTKYDKECTPDVPEEKVFPVLFTGTGNHVQATQEFLRRHKLALASDGTPPLPGTGAASWILAFSDSEHYPRNQLKPGYVGVRFEKIVLQVRHPLTAIAERGMRHLNPFIEYHIEENSPRGPAPEIHLVRALMHYVTWHEHLLQVADVIFREEDGDLYEICQQLFGQECPARDAQPLWGEFIDYHTAKENGSIAQTSWAELERISPEYAERAKKIASHLGYCISGSQDPELFDRTFKEIENNKWLAKNGGRSARRLSTSHSHSDENRLEMQEPSDVVSIEKFTWDENPVITRYSFMKTKQEMTPSHNVGSPALIEVPSWVKNPLGKYYLYTSGSQGQYVRLHFANDPTGPYHLHRDGVLPITSLPFCGVAVGTPFVITDEKNEQLTMYFHCGHCVNPEGSDKPLCKKNVPASFLATSKDGLTWEPVADPLLTTNVRAVTLGDFTYLMGRSKVFATAPGATGMHEVGNVPAPVPTPFRLGDSLFQFWTVCNKTHGHMLVAKADLTSLDFTQEQTHLWSSFSKPKVLTWGDQPWELPVHGGVIMRDPSVLKTSDGRIFFAYTTAADASIAVMEVKGLERL